MPKKLILKLNFTLSKMELYLDSADIKEIEEAFKLGSIAGLTTTPTFMHRHGITDIDGTILKLAKIVPVLQIEALGQTSDEIVKEVHCERHTRAGRQARCCLKRSGPAAAPESW